MIARINDGAPQFVFITDIARIQTDLVRPRFHRHDGEIRREMDVRDDRQDRSRDDLFEERDFLGRRHGEARQMTARGGGRSIWAMLPAASLSGMLFIDWTTTSTAPIVKSPTCASW